MVNLTERDHKLLEFIEMCPTNSNIISEYLGCSLQVVQRRLLKLYEYEYIKRWRIDINSNYIYYSPTSKTKPRDLFHMLTLSRLYMHWFKKGYDIKLFRREVPLYKGIRCDGLAVVDRGRGMELLVLEVEATTRPQDKVKKYEKYKSERGYVELCSKMPKLVFITNKSATSKELELEFIRFKELE